MLSIRCIVHCHGCTVPYSTVYRYSCQSSICEPRTNSPYKNHANSLAGALKYNPKVFLNQCILRAPYLKTCVAEEGTQLSEWRYAAHCRRECNRSDCSTVVCHWCAKLWEQGARSVASLRHSPWCQQATTTKSLAFRLNCASNIFNRVGNSLWNANQTAWAD